MWFIYSAKHTPEENYLKSNCKEISLEISAEHLAGCVMPIVFARVLCSCEENCTRLGLSLFKLFLKVLPS